MPLVPDHTASLRQLPPELEEEQGMPTPEDVTVNLGEDDPANDNGDRPIRDDKGNVIKIEHSDGSVTVSINGQPLEKAVDPDRKVGWFDNLVEDIEQQEVGRIADDLLQGIGDDIESRREYIEDRAIGIKLLGLKIDLPNTQSSSDAGPVEGMSKVRHPLLLEACLRFQANASGEMLPADGPAKIRNDDINANVDEDNLANAYEKDLNHYLTTTATEYYPDTDRMYLMLGFGGSSFKKVYFCPLRNRPVSESVDAGDVIVNANATDLLNARRITHRSTVKPSTIKRLQILGVYRDINLPDASSPDLDSAQLEKKSQEGISPDVNRASDRDRELYEVCCELDIKGYEHKHKGKATGLEIPYRVTIDVSSKQILSIVRNYNEDDQELPTARKMFVQYVFIPGFGFYGIGLLHILGNTTNAITAGWRELLDAGMFSNFPGFLIADSGARQNTNIFRIPAGGAALIKTGGMKIGDAVAQLPYKEPSAALLNLVKQMEETGQRVGGTSELQIGEGRADAPVGTTLTMVEQAQKVLNSVHKRMHRAQTEEFEMLVECFREHPDAFWQRNKRPAMPWDQERFLTALNDFQLTPRADPNTASYIQRVLKIMALKQLQAASPMMYDPVAIDKAALKALGWNNPDQFMAPPEKMGQKPPQVQQAEAEMQTKMMDATTRKNVGDAKVAEVQAKIKGGAFSKEGGNAEQPDTALGMANLMKAKAAMLSAETKAQEIEVRHKERGVEDENRDLDRHSRERVALLGLAKDLAMHPIKAEEDEKQREHERQMQQSEHEGTMQEIKAKPKPAGGKKKSGSNK